jgi:hypothetical protein
VASRPSARRGKRDSTAIFWADHYQRHGIASDAFQVVSDGDWDDEWAQDATYPPTGMSTRGLVAELFGECPAESPLAEF